MPILLDLSDMVGAKTNLTNAILNNIQDESELKVTPAIKFPGPKKANVPALAVGIPKKIFQGQPVDIQ